jgi:hypothetical protein
VGNAVTKLDLAFLLSASDRAQAIFWCILNARDWPRWIPYPEPDSARASAIRAWIQGQLGLSKCLEMWNEFRFYRGVRWAESNHGKAINEIVSE